MAQTFTKKVRNRKPRSARPPHAPGNAGGMPLRRSGIPMQSGATPAMQPPPTPAPATATSAPPLQATGIPPSPDNSGGGGGYARGGQVAKFAVGGVTPTGQPAGNPADQSVNGSWGSGTGNGVQGTAGNYGAAGTPASSFASNGPALGPTLGTTNNGPGSGRFLQAHPNFVSKGNVPGWAVGGTRSNPYGLGNYSSYEGNRGSGSFGGIGPAETSQKGANAWLANFQANNPTAQMGPPINSSGQFMLGAAEGGAIPDFGDNQASQPVLDPETLLNASMDTLEYTRQQAGLGGGFAANTDQMRPSTNVEDNRQGPGSIDTNSPVTKAQANQATPNINGTVPGSIPSPYTGTPPMMGAQPPGFKSGGAIPDPDGKVIPWKRAGGDQKFDDGGSVEDTGGDSPENDEDTMPEAGEQEPAQQAQPSQTPSSPGEFMGSVAKAAGAQEQPGAIPSSPQDAMSGTGFPPSIMGYLTGQGGVPQQQLDQAKQKVDPNNQMNGTEKTMAAIASAPNQKAAASIMQAARAQYITMKAGAAAALTGTDKGGPNLNVSVTNANQAYNNVPDGNHIMFSPGQDGASVDVNVSPITGQPKQFHLTIPQYNQFLHGQGGQFDNLMEQDVSQVISRIAQSGGRPVQQHRPGVGGTPPQGGAPQAPQTPQPPQGGAPQAPQPAAPGTGQTVRAPSGNVYQRGANGTLQAQTMAEPGQPQFAGPSNTVDAFAEFPQGQVAAAQRMFPKSPQQQLSWLYGQKQQAAGLANKLEVAKNTRLYGSQATAEGRQVAAATAAASRQAVANIAANAKVIAAQTNDPARKAQLQFLSSMAANGVDTEAVKAQAIKMGFDWGALTQAPRAGGAQPVQTGGRNSPPPVNLLKEGYVTTFKNGQKWKLQNGQPVQAQ